MSMSVRCSELMLTSAVTGRPSALARRTSSTPAALDSRHRWTRVPVWRTSSMMVCSAIVSEATGTPDRPSRVATAPLRLLRTQPHGVAVRAGVLHRTHQREVVLDRMLALREADAAGFGERHH